MLAYGGHGVEFDNASGNLLIMNNNFAAATYRGVGISENGGWVQGAAIFNNTLGEGSTFHVQLPFTNSFGIFLRQNTYLNSFSNSISPFLDPIASAVHSN